MLSKQHSNTHLKSIHENATVWPPQVELPFHSLCLPVFVSLFFFGRLNTMDGMNSPSQGTAQPAVDPQAQAEQQTRTLWVGNVTPGMDEAMLVQLFTSAGEPPVETKVMRDKFTNQASGYGFAVFASTDQAQRVLTNLNGQTAPGTQYTYVLRQRTKTRLLSGKNFSSLQRMFPMIHPFTKCLHVSHAFIFPISAAQIFHPEQKLIFVFFFSFSLQIPPELVLLQAKP
jgi:RNA recognition motif-containing protein